MSVLSNIFVRKATLLACLLGSVGFIGGEAFAQAAKTPAKAAAPAQPAAPAQSQPAQQGQQAAPQGPIAVELQPSQGEWTKVCGKDQVANKEICYTTRDFGQGPDQPPVLALAIYDVKGDDTRMVRLLLPVSLLLRPGFRFVVDKGAPQEGAFEICFPNGCFAEAKVKAAAIDQLKKGTQLSIMVRNQANNEVTFKIPLKDFATAFDGPPIDPKVLEEQQKALEEQLRKQAEAERKKLEAAQPPAANGAAPAAPAKK